MLRCNVKGAWPYGFGARAGRAGLGHTSDWDALPAREGGVPAAHREGRNLLWVQGLRLWGLAGLEFQDVPDLAGFEPLFKLLLLRLLDAEVLAAHPRQHFSERTGNPGPLPCRVLSKSCFMVSSSQVDTSGFPTLIHRHPACAFLLD